MKNFTIKLKIVYSALFAIMAICFVLGIVLLPNTAQAKEITSIKITVDAESYNVYDLPHGVQGRTYPVFNCYATDNNGGEVTDVDTLVYAPDGQLISIVNDRFATEKIGTYKVEYIANANGVQKVFTVNVPVVAQSEHTEISYMVSDSIVSATDTGSKVYLYDTVPSGGSGVIKVDMDIVYSGEYDVDNIEVYDLKDVKYFVPTAEGIYQLKYTLLDVTGVPKIVSKNVVVSDSGIPVMNEPSFPAVYTVEETINFPRVQSVLYINGKTVYLPVRIFVNDTDVSESAKYTPTTAGDYTVKFISVNPFENGKQAEIVKDIKVLAKKAAADPIINTKLYLDGLTASYRGKSDDESLESYVYLLTADGTQESAEMKFRNKIPTGFLSMKAGIESSLYNYTSIGVRFTDSIKGNHYIDIEFKKSSDETKINVYYKGNLVGEIDAATAITVEYDYLKMAFICADTLSFTVNTYENGDRFDGFESGFVYFSLTMNGISGESRLKLYEIASQKITNAIIDNAAPVIVRGTFTGVFNTDIGKAVTLPKLNTFDLLSDTVSLALTITSPSGKDYSVAKMTQDYVFMPEEYGMHRVSYTAKDLAGKTKSFICTINVMDRTPPEITVEHIGNVKVGETVNFPKATIIDNNNAIYYAWVSVEYDSYVKVIAEDDTWTFKFAGTYIIEYGASDEDGNYTVYKYTITCE